MSKKENASLQKKIRNGKTTNQYSMIETAKEAKGVHLADDELDKVFGGWLGGLIDNCPKQYDYILCELSLCPAYRRNPMRCLNGHWDGSD